MTTLPIDSVLPDLRNTFHRHHNIVLSADPGAGKTTRVPLALLSEPWLSGKKIIMLEPRRLAAQRAASYMAQQLGETAGETIGYRIRGDSKISKRTRVEVVTEGILTRLLQSDSSLQDVGLVICDEFHERSIHADLGLALTLNVQEHLRSDLRILIMSATLDGVAVSSLLGDAPVIRSEGRSFPVTTNYLQRPNDGAVESLVVSSVLRALREESGDILVFLPGQKEIRNIEGSLVPKLEELSERSSGDVIIHMLYGEASPEKQQAALSPAPKGKRKVILSTSIAETSLTIDGVRVVIDSGLARTIRFDPRRGMSGLVTTPVSQSSADQRRGRAGRQQPGACYRLWTEAEQHQLPKFSQPEILVADLAPLALDLAQWGTPQGEGLRFLDPPLVPHLSQARTLLVQLGAIDESGKTTTHGKAMAEFPVHPRFSHMLIRGKELGIGVLACDVAALLEERDLLRGDRDKEIDLHSRWYALRKGNIRDKFSRERILSQATRLRERLDVKDEKPDENKLGLLLALAYPERIAKQRGEHEMRYQLAIGTGAMLPKGSMLSRTRYLAIAEVDGIGNDVKIFLAEPVAEEDIRAAFHDQLKHREEIRWDDRREMVVARSVEQLGAIELSEIPLSSSGDAVKEKMLEGIRLMGLDALPWTDNAISIRVRSEWLRKLNLVSSDWPKLDTEHFHATLGEWLGPYLGGITKRSHLTKLEMSTIVQSLFSYQQLRELDRLAPTHHTVPTGSKIPIDYSTDGSPILAVRLQEMFGETETPAVGGGKIKVVLHLLSPARRPLAVTQDLPSFWQNTYPDVRKDMRGRYPKHSWPENPREAEPTRRVKMRM